MTTGCPGDRGSGAPVENVTLSPRRGSSGRGGTPGWYWYGSNRVDGATTLVDAADMVDPEVVEEVSVVRRVTDEHVGLFAGGQRTDPIAAPQRRRAVERQRRDDLARQHAHLRTCHRADQREVFRRTRPRVAVARQRHRRAALD